MLLALASTAMLATGTAPALVAPAFAAYTPAASVSAPAPSAQAPIARTLATSASFAHMPTVRTPAVHTPTATSAHTPTAITAQSTLAGELRHELAIAGLQSGAYVYDLNTATPLFAERATVAHPPASVEKLYTATTALELMGPTATLSTAVLATGHLGLDGRWEGSLYLRGGGDPTFGSPRSWRAITAGREPP